MPGRPTEASDKSNYIQLSRSFGSSVRLQAPTAHLNWFIAGRQCDKDTDINGHILFRVLPAPLTSTEDIPTRPHPMAAMAVDAPQSPSSGSSNRLGMPSRNPLPLSASQEAQVRDVFHARVRRQCGPEIKGMGFFLDSLHPPLPPYVSLMPLSDVIRRLFNFLLPICLLTFSSSSSSLRRMRSWSHLFHTLRVPRTAPADE